MRLGRCARIWLPRESESIEAWWRMEKTVRKEDGVRVYNRICKLVQFLGSFRSSSVCVY
jgi:hypothetical protein